ncbi:MAG: hypothetical protein P4L53_23175 [Candidatus Obscuribacterales bacterium]|nr:hypothetical protein [Candidatus Obscuribacterales bacterium]
MIMFVTIAHKSLERLDALIAANKWSNYGDVCSAAINYPKGTFTQVGEPVYDGQGCVVRIECEDWRDHDLEVIAQRNVPFQRLDTFLGSILADC